MDKILPCEYENCNHDRPDLMVENYRYVEVHDLCLDARDGFSGTIDYRFVREMMVDMGIEPDERVEIIRKIMLVEKFLKKNKPQKQGTQKTSE